MTSPSLSKDNIYKALALLAARLELAQFAPMGLVVCGGAALIATGLRRRTTRDVGMVALLDSNNVLASPDPLPEFLVAAADRVARDLGLFAGWLNNGPSRGDGGLFQLGLPDGFVGRLTRKEFGSR
jgi:hypothetical protein